MALAVCKVCQKSICLMCVHEEKDGTFCSEACISNFREVSDWVGGASSPSPAAAQPQPAVTAVEAPPAPVFEEMPERTAEVSHPDPVSIPETTPPEAPPPPQPAPVAPGIGNPCHAHPDIRAKAFCTRCRKPICGLCIIENAAGMFCSDACAAAGRSKRSGAGAKAAVVLLVLAVAAGAVYALKPEFVKGLLAGVLPGKNEPPPVPAPPEKTKTPTPEPPKPEPPKPEPPKPEPPKPEPPKPEPPKPEPPKPEPPKPEPPKPVPPKPEPPKPPPPKPQPPGPTIIVHPWGFDEPGTWYRIQRGARLEDVGLKERDALSYTLSLQGWDKGSAGAASVKKVELEPIELLGEETLEIEDRTYLCEVRRIKTANGYDREWTLASTRHAGAVLRAETSEGFSDAVRVWEHSIRLGERNFDCLVVESRLSGGRFVKTWYCPTYPLKKVRVERDGVLVESLVDWGYDWTQRPSPK